MANAAAGWYDQGDGRQRYWDGTAWTEHFAPAAPPAVPPAAAAAPPVAEPGAYAAPPAAAAGASQYATAPMPGAMASMPGAVAIPQKKRRVWPWIVGIGGVLVLLAIGVIVLFVVVLNKASEGPREAVHDFDTAWRTGDCSLLEQTTTEAYREFAGWTDCEAFKASGPMTTEGLELDITGFNVSGNNASVTTRETYPEENATYTGTYELVKLDGEWKIDTVSLVE